MELPEETLKKADSMTYLHTHHLELYHHRGRNGIVGGWRRRDLSVGGRGIPIVQKRRWG